MQSPSAADVRHLAQAKRLLVVSDFDGTLAEFSTDPYNVPVHQGAVAALRTLAQKPETTVAILSGRDVEGLRAASGFGQEFVLVGSHGAECSDAPVHLTSQQREALAAVEAKFEEILQGIDDAFVEHKPFHRVLHVAKVEDQQVAQAAIDAALKVKVEGVRVQPGRCIVEAAVTDVTKGSWVREEQARLQPDATLFLGDDTTDETVFAILGPNDLGVKVGQGQTKATRRVEGVAAVAAFLEQLASAR